MPLESPSVNASIKGRGFRGLSVMSTESANPTSNMSDSVSSASDSGHEMTNETEEYPDDVSEVYSSEIFETVKKALRADRRVAQYAVETRQCLQAILTFVEAER